MPAPHAPHAPSVVAIWLGSDSPVRSVRWLDGALAVASRFPGAIAVAAGEIGWLDLAADRAARVGLASVGVPTDLQLDYLGWAQVIAAVARELGASIVLVDEASRPERFAEVAAIAELTDAAQLSHVVALAPDGNVIHTSRAAGGMLQTVRVHGPAVIGLRVAGPPIDEYPTPMPSASMRHLELTELGLDPSVLGHRALPPRTHQARRTVDRVAEHLAVHIAPRAVTASAASAPASAPAKDTAPKINVRAYTEMRADIKPDGRARPGEPIKPKRGKGAKSE